MLLPGDRVISSRGMTFSTTRCAPRAPPCGLIPLHGAVHKKIPKTPFYAFRIPKPSICIKSRHQTIPRQTHHFYLLLFGVIVHFMKLSSIALFLLIIIDYLRSLYFNKIIDARSLSCSRNRRYRKCSKGYSKFHFLY